MKPHQGQRAVSIARAIDLSILFQSGGAPSSAHISPMMIGGLRVVLHLPESHSLKDKRQIVRSVLARIRNEFPVSSAEVGDTERWQIAELGFACVNESASIVTEILDKVVRYIEDTRPDLEILEQAQEIMQMA